jgi:hypothetical protein
MRSCDVTTNGTHTVSLEKKGGCTQTHPPRAREEGGCAGANTPGGKLDTDGRLGLEIELVPREPREQVGLAYSRVTNQHDCIKSGRGEVVMVVGE